MSQQRFNEFVNSAIVCNCDLICAAFIRREAKSVLTNTVNQQSFTLCNDFITFIEKISKGTTFECKFDPDDDTAYFEPVVGTNFFSDELVVVFTNLEARIATTQKNAQLLVNGFKSLLDKKHRKECAGFLSQFKKNYDIVLKLFRNYLPYQQEILSNEENQKIKPFGGHFMRIIQHVSPSVANRWFAANGDRDRDRGPKSGNQCSSNSKETSAESELSDSEFKRGSPTRNSRHRKRSPKSRDNKRRRSSSSFGPKQRQSMKVYVVNKTDYVYGHDHEKKKKSKKFKKSKKYDSNSESDNSMTESMYTHRFHNTTHSTTSPPAMRSASAGKLSTQFSYIFVCNKFLKFYSKYLAPNNAAAAPLFGGGATPPNKSVDKTRHSNDKKTVQWINESMAGMTFENTVPEAFTRRKQELLQQSKNDNQNQVKTRTKSIAGRTIMEDIPKVIDVRPAAVLVFSDEIWYEAAKQQMTPIYQIQLVGLRKLKTAEYCMNDKEIRLVKEFIDVANALALNHNKAKDAHYKARLVTAIGQTMERVQTKIREAPIKGVSLAEDTNFFEAVAKNAYPSGANLLKEDSKNKSYECNSTKMIENIDIEIRLGAHRCTKYPEEDVKKGENGNVKIKCEESFYPYKVRIKDQYRAFKYVLSIANCAEHTVGKSKRNVKNVVELYEKGIV